MGDSEEIKYLSLFSGIGGFEKGIENSKYADKLVCAGYSEVDFYADSIYRRRFKSRLDKEGNRTHIPFGDVRKIKTSELPSFEFLVAGFPCQSFSNNGWGQGLSDTRGTLFFEIGRILQDCRPKHFLLENVQGLLHNQYGETFQRMLGIFSELGYDVQWEIINSTQIGIPHHRERVFLKGYSREGSERRILHHRLFDGKYVVQAKTQRLDEPFLKIRESTKKGYKEAYAGDGVLLNRSTSKIAKGIVRDNHCGCLQTQRIWGVVESDLRIRYLTPLECERIQGFDDNWTKYTVDGQEISDPQRYRLLGNAVNVGVVTHIIDNWEIFQ